MSARPVVVGAGGPGRHDELDELVEQVFECRRLLDDVLDRLEPRIAEAVEGAFVDG